MTAKALSRLCNLVISPRNGAASEHRRVPASIDAQAVTGALNATKRDVSRHLATGVVTFGVMTLAIGIASSRLDAQAKTNNANGAKVAGNSAEHRNDARGRNADLQTVVAGPTGPMGPEGPMGPTGPTGATGATGATGPEGAKGADGAQGLAGPVGPAGAPGSQGPQGAMGLQGFQGAPGATGATGADGAMGPAGPAGPQGAMGNTGANGADGAVGPAGPQGAPGPTGATGPAGADGAPGPTGAQGLEGVQGPVGPTGTFVPAEQTLAYGAGVFTHYEDPTWVLESLNSGTQLQLRRTASASPPNAPNQPPANFLVFGMMHPQNCAGSMILGTGNAMMKHVFRYANNPFDTLSASFCLEGSFVMISVQDQEKRTELRCTRVSSGTVVCQKVN